MPVAVISLADGRLFKRELEEGETCVGRDPSNDLVLDGRGVSRYHAKFVVDHGCVTVIDLGSTYGTRVNELLTVRKELLDGDRLVIGMHKVRIRLDESASIDQLKEPPTPLFFSDDTTEVPPADDVHHRRTVPLNLAAVQFVLDNPDSQGRAINVLQREESELAQAVDRIETSQSTSSRKSINNTEAQALGLMYRVNELLTGVTDLDAFLGPVADLVIGETEATTVIILLQEEGGDLKPQAIRHQGPLAPGEVPISQGIVDRVSKEQATVISADVETDDRLSLGQSGRRFGIRSVIAAPIIVAEKLRGVLYLNRSTAPPFAPADGNLATVLAGLLANGIERTELMEKVFTERQRRRALERFHPPEVVKHIASNKNALGSLADCTGTVLVCRLAGFQQLLHACEARELARVLHEYYELLFDTVFANAGSLVKLHDDRALALFGVAKPSRRDAVWAVETAFALCSEVRMVASFWPYSDEIGMRCALATGPLLAGPIGAMDRLEFVALGGPVTAADDLVRRAAAGEVLISEETWQQLPQARYEAERLSGDHASYRLTKK